MQASMQDITAITVSHNTVGLLRNAIDSFRKFHPDMHLIIIEGSTPGNPCQEYAKTLASDKTTVAIANYNIGHGRGMHTAIGMCETRFALIFDTDVVFIKSPVEAMLAMMEDDTYGVGYLERTGYDGFEYGAKIIHKKQGYMLMMHPFFHLLQVKNYYKFHRYVHHGAPCFKAALDIHRKGLSEKILKPFPGLGHTSGKGFVWTAVPATYIRHDTAGTRKARRKIGKPEIEPGWER